MKIGQKVIFKNDEHLIVESLVYELNEVVEIYKVFKCDSHIVCCDRNRCNGFFINNYCGYRFKSLRLEKLKRIL